MSECSEASSRSDVNVLDSNTQVVVSDNSENPENSPNGPSELEVTGRKSSVDILSEPVETKVQTDNTESNYNRIDFKQPVGVSKPTATIISTVTVAKPGYQTNLLLDDKGYSHVNLSSIKVQNDSDKMRSLSNNSNRSSVSCRSASTGSRDSGILNAQEKSQDEVSKRHIAHRSTNSFDSAVSTSSTVENKDSVVLDTKATNLSVEIHEVEVSLQKESEHLDTAGEACIYQDVSFGESKSETNNTLRPKLRKSNSTGHFKTEENPYEELDKYRKGKKDLVKLLGMDPKVDPSSVPPSLPDRPVSYKMKRKFGANTDKKLFTLPFAKSKSRKNRDKAMSSSSSDSDSESGGTKKKDDLSSIKVWPLGDTSVAGNNELYQPIAIERFLNDNDAVASKITRERSCSLNLNRTPDVKRPSISSANVELRGGARVKHGRNASLNVDLLSSDRNKDSFFPPNENEAFVNSFRTDQNSPVSPLQSPVSPTNSFDDEMAVDDLIENVEHHDNEPIYAEVLPVGSKPDEIEEPFPNLDEWKPQNLSDFQTNELDETHYENNGDSTVDLFNIGFVSKNERSENTDSKTGILIDIFDTEVPTDTDKTQSLSALDIFNATNSSIVSHIREPDTNSNQISAEMNQAFHDIFSLGNDMQLPSSSADLWNTGNNLSKKNSSVAYTSMTTDENWADFSQFEANQPETTTNTISDSIYMDMSTCKNESIYVLPSEAKRQ